MGLDMYLYGERYVSGWDHNPDQDFGDVVKAAGMDGLVAPGSPHAKIEVCVAYWRKANAIHKWFVDNCQDGKDDCGTYYVGREQLIELRDLCRKVLLASRTEDGEVDDGETWHGDGTVTKNVVPGRVVSTPAVAEEHLPTQGGFFFGGTGYDEWYLRDLEETVKQIDNVLAAPERVSFSYHSSW